MERKPIIRSPGLIPIPREEEETCRWPGVVPPSEERYGIVKIQQKRIERLKQELLDYAIACSEISWYHMDYCNVCLECGEKFYPHQHHLGKFYREGQCFGCKALCGNPHACPDCVCPMDDKDETK